MQIRDASATSVARTYTRQIGALDPASVRSLQPANKGRARSDSVTLSPVRQEVARVEDVVAQQPDVRSETVSALRGSIARGSYTTDSAALAARLLG